MNVLIDMYEYEMDEIDHYSSSPIDRLNTCLTAALVDTAVAHFAVPSISHANHMYELFYVKLQTHTFHIYCFADFDCF